LRGLFSVLSAMAASRPGATKGLQLLREVGIALENRGPVVALESAVITHGLPYPTNLELARDMEAAVQDEGATPATIAVIDGQMRVGMPDTGLAVLAKAEFAEKLGPRDLASAAIRQHSGGTTVGATMLIAARAGIHVHATGGIGGVHRERTFDISADMRMLASTPMIVVCAGAKSVLDLPATLELLETMCVPVIGYQTTEFPAFYARESGLTLGLQLDSPGEIARYWATHREVGLQSTVLVTNPVPEGDAMPRAEIEPILEQASREAIQRGIGGKPLTPFLLGRINELTEGRSMKTNLALLRSNAHLAGQIAVAVARLDSESERIP
jgi:pseudouridine-5'-phosphate glycosidase